MLIASDFNSGVGKYQKNMETYEENIVARNLLCDSKDCSMMSCGRILKIVSTSQTQLTNEVMLEIAKAV